MELIDDVCHMESRFGLFGDSISFGEHRCMFCAEWTTGSETILDTLNGTCWRSLVLTFNRQLIMEKDLYATNT